jgi:formylglycine-generating enzyme required for sulfatase activity
MSRAWRAASPIAFAFAALVTSAACGGDDPAGGSSTPAFGDGGVKNPPPAQVTPTTTCTSDADCKNGGKCKDVGAQGKACVVSKSCTGGSGANAACGDGRDCCDARAVPGGTFDRFNDADFPAKVSPFILDTFEVTAGRFRAWVEATNGNLRASAPAAGAGAHPKIPSSGWKTEWNTQLPASRADVDKMLGPDQCQVGTNLDDYGTLTWWTSEVDAKVKASNKGNASVLAENTKQALDGKAINCIPWYVLFAFCVWDGGRLPTDAEWSFALAGGSEQRGFPWGNVPAKDLAQIGENNQLSFVPVFAAGKDYLSAALWDKTSGPNVFPDWYVHTYGEKFRTKTDNAAHLAPVGKKPLGNGKWGHADLAGGVWEWMLNEGPIRPGTCNDCANVAWPAVDGKDPNAVKGPPDFEDRWFVGGARSVRGGAWDNALGLATAQTKIEVEWYTSYPVKRTYRSLGGRCARDL